MARYRRSLHTEGVAHLGTVYFGDVHYHGIGEQQTAALAEFVDARVVEKAKLVYVLTGDAERARAILQTQSLLVLAGPSRTGRFTTALYLLSDLDVGAAECADGGAIREVYPGITPEQLRDFSFVSGSRYVLRASGEKFATIVDSYFLRSLASKLAEAESRLVLVVPSLPTTHHAYRDPYVVHWSTCPCPQDVLYTHVCYYGNSQTLPSGLAALLGRDEVRAAMSQASWPGQLDLPAQQLVEVLEGRLTLEKVLLTWSRGIDDAAQRWFQDHQDAELRVQMIALAALDGASSTAISQAFIRLKTALGWPDEEAQRQLPLAGKGRHERLEELGALTGCAEEDTEWGPVAVEVLRLGSEDLAPAVLAHVWGEYDRYRGALLGWFRELVHLCTLAIAPILAVTAGELARLDFIVVVREILIPWAESESRLVQFTAALALDVPAAAPQFSASVLELVLAWSRDSSPALRWTAIVALGFEIGRRNPRRALGILLHLAGEGDLEAFLACRASVLRIFASGDEDASRYLVVLAFFEANYRHHYSDHRRLTRTLLGLGLLEHRAKSMRAETEECEPVVLSLGVEFEQVRRTVGRIMADALAQDILRDDLRRIIAEWLALADKNQVLYGSVAYSLFEMLSMSRDYHRKLAMVAIRREVSKYTQAPVAGLDERLTARLASRQMQTDTTCGVG